jgi:hypothetical protein
MSTLLWMMFAAIYLAGLIGPTPRAASVGQVSA